jgi:D-alanyl-D-alanine dipeptidase
LREARDYLRSQQPAWQILIFDAYRPVPVQQFMVDYTFRQILQREGLTMAELTWAQRGEIYEQVYQIWALPSQDPQTPPPHSTGAAIDLTLIDETGHPLEMGGDIDELSPRSQPDYYRQLLPQTASEADIFSSYQQRRDFLNEIMTAAGFLRHPGEWWHFSQGDQLWAWQQNQRQSTGRYVACYGRIE